MFDTAVPFVVDRLGIVLADAVSARRSAVPENDALEEAFAVDEHTFSIF